MRKLLLLVVAAALAGNLSAQQFEYRRGYIGICAGPAFPLGDIDRDAVSGGAQLNLVNFGYLFSRHVGLTATWFGTAFLNKADSDNSIGTGGILAGPLFSTATPNYAVEFDLKPMIGFANASVQYHGYSSSSRAFAFGLGGTVRWNCGRRISLSGGLDYYNVQPEGIDMSSLAVVFGISYRLK